jgi:hypothetical protein
MEQRNENVEKVWMIINWGFDGSTGQSQYNQKVDKNENYDEKSLVATTITPLKIVTADDDCYWTNCLPHSTRFVRPKEIMYIKETKEVVLDIYKRFQMEIDDIKEFSVKLSDSKELIFCYIFYCTAIDGKVLAIITGTDGNQNCPLCKSTPTEMSTVENFSNGQFEIDDSLCQFGISHLHAWIRFFECIIHISYRFVS